jgi:hypothetical protein
MYGVSEMYPLFWIGLTSLRHESGILMQSEGGLYELYVLLIYVQVLCKDHVIV